MRRVGFFFLFIVCIEVFADLSSFAASEDRAGGNGRRSAGVVVSKNDVEDVEIAACKEQLGELVEMCRGYIANGFAGKVAKLDVDDRVVPNFMMRYCRHTLVADRLNEQERKSIAFFAVKVKEGEKSLPVDELSAIKGFAAYPFRHCDKLLHQYTRQELDVLGRQFAQTMLDMSAAVARNDIDKAVGYYASSVRDAWRQQFKRLPEDARQKYYQDMKQNEIQVVRIEGDVRAICQLLTMRNGERYSFQLTFVKGEDEGWKIYSY